MHGDFAATRVEGEFALVFLVFNTISNLVTQDAQVACFINAAEHLRSGGRFVIENGVPALQSLPPGQTVLPFRADAEGFSFDVYDVVTQASAHSTSTSSTGGSRPIRCDSVTPGRPSST